MPVEQALSNEMVTKQDAKLLPVAFDMVTGGPGLIHSRSKSFGEASLTASDLPVN